MSSVKKTAVVAHDFGPMPTNPELTYTLELARVLDATISDVDAAQKRVEVAAAPKLAFDRALIRGRNAILDMLREACEEVAPGSTQRRLDETPETAEARRFLAELQMRNEKEAA